MFKTESNDPLDELFDDAQAIVAKRNQVLEAVQAAESRLAEVNEQTRAARERQEAEEFAAAQFEGCLAVASKAAQQATAEAELQVKTVKFRLQGLRAQVQKVEADLLAAWERLQSYRDDFLQQRASELSEEADRAVESLRDVICKALAFRHHAGVRLGEKYGHRLARMIDGFTSNAMSHIQGHQVSIQGGIFSGPDGGKWGLAQHWDRAPSALEFSEAIQVVDDRVSPIGAVVAEVRPKQ